MQTQRGGEWRQGNVETAPFYTNKEVDHLIKEVEVCMFHRWTRSYWTIEPKQACRIVNYVKYIHHMHQAVKHISTGTCNCVYSIGTCYLPNNFFKLIIYQWPSFISKWWFYFWNMKPTTFLLSNTVNVVILTTCKFWLYWQFFSSKFSLINLQLWSEVIKSNKARRALW